MCKFPNTLLMCCHDLFVLFRGIKPLEMHNAFGFGTNSIILLLRQMHFTLGVKN